MAILGPLTERGLMADDAVLAMTTCENCTARRSVWQWGDCYAPSLPDARLISKAPELVDLLERILAATESQPLDTPAVDEARTLLQQIRGAQ